MNKFVRKSLTFTFALVSGIFTFVPESFFAKPEWITQKMLDQYAFLSHFDFNEINILISRLMCFFVVWIVTALLYTACLIFRPYVTIKGQNYLIRIEYGNILKKKKCKKVITFDECFTTKVGSTTSSINSDSICGQYLALHPDLDIQQLVEDAKIEPDANKSKYKQKTRYASGTIVPNGDDLLMAFAKLDEKGKGRFFKRDEYLECLDLLWKEIENHYSEKDVCIPILGSGTTSFDGGDGASIPQQDLLNMMICSYKLSSHKIKSPHKLCIVCKRKPEFSLNRIEK